MGTNYVLITPVKDEYLNFPHTIRSVLNQEIHPDKWVIIDDGSTDGTKELIRDLCQLYEWVVPVYNTPDGLRKPGGEFILKKGFDLLNISEYAFIAKMDADLSFGGSLFKDILEEFRKNPSLGIAGGSCFIKLKNKMVEETHTRIHIRGPLKVYRRECFIDIGGILPMLGWDTIDELKAHQYGWETRTFPYLKIHHLRATQSAEGQIRGLRNMAQASYYLGYSPLYMILRSVTKMKHKPYIIGSFAMLIEFFKNYIDKSPQIPDAELKKYIRKEQIKKIFHRESTWS